MAALTVGILRLDWFTVVDCEQGVEAVDDFLGALGLVLSGIQCPLFSLLDGGSGLDFGRVEVGHVGLVAAEDGHRLLHIGLTALVVAHASLGLATCHVTRLKVGILLQDGREIVDGLAELACAHVQQGTVIQGHEVGRVALEYKVKIADGLVVVPHLGTQQSAIEMCLLTGRIQTDGVIIVGHGAEIVVQIIFHERAVDEVACVTGFQQDGTVHIGQATLKVMQ